MTSDPIPMEYKELIREFHPKRDQMNKIHRWRYTTLEDDHIAKVVFIDGLKKGEKLEEAVCDQIISHVELDWTGIKLSARYYSLKKHKRWELPDLLESYLPAFADGFQIPIPVTGTSLARFNCYRTHGYGEHVKNLTVLDRKGERKTYPGGMNKGNIGQIVRTLKKNDEATVPTIHVQFQTMEFKLVPRKHNSRKFDYRSGRYRYDEEPVFNARIVREEFPFCDCSYQCDACTGKDSRDPNWNEYEYEYDACSLCKFPPNILIFGDFFNVNSIPQENRHRKCDLKDWVLL